MANTFPSEGNVGLGTTSPEQLSALAEKYIAPLGERRADAWSQFHADASNEGSLFVASGFALHPAWSLDVGPVLYSSPVIGSDGTIYLGNAQNRLVAVNPDGTLKWDVQLNAAIMATPAVAENGDIYVVTTEFLPDQTLCSWITRVAPTGTALRTRQLPQRRFTTASPKTWTIGNLTYVFLYARDRTISDKSALLVYNENLDMVETADMACNLPVSANPLKDFLKDVWDFLKDAKDFFMDGLEFDVSGLPAVQPFKRFGWLDPTVAIAEKPGFATHERPVVVTASIPCELRAFRWNPPNLEPLWTEEHKVTLTSSPAVLNFGSLVVVGRLDGKVVGYDLVTGGRLWVHDVKEPVMGTPASLGGLVYVASLKHIHALEPATGDEVFSSELRGETLASVAMSGSHVYVSSARPTGEFDMITSGKELESFSFDFQKRGHDVEGGGGLASPAIASNGTVYAVATEGDRAFLRAYRAP